MRYNRLVFPLVMTACLIANQLIAGTPDGSRTVDNPKSGGGIAISASDASRMAQSYPGDKPINPRQGFFLSKAALDSIFQHDESATGIMLVPVRDEGDNLNLVVKGYRSEKIVVDSRAGNSVFLMQMYCPTDCEMLNQLGKE